jgi:hypothetical protein
MCAYNRRSDALTFDSPLIATYNDGLEELVGNLLRITIALFDVLDCIVCTRNGNALGSIFG